jgi:hypothetical protein
MTTSSSEALNHPSSSVNMATASVVAEVVRAEGHAVDGDPQARTQPDVTDCFTHLAARSARWAVRRTQEQGRRPEPWSPRYQPPPMKAFADAERADVAEDEAEAARRHHR